MEEEKINIIIPCYNSKTLPITLKSIEIQTMNIKDLVHVTIIDDCSDISYDLSNYNLDIEYIKLKKRKSIGYVRQYGLDNSKYNIVTFLDSDDLLFSVNSLEVLYNVMRFKPVVQGKNLDYSFYTNKEPNFNDAFNGIWLHGLMFKLDKIREHNIKFRDVSEGEDTNFVQQLKLNFFEDFVYINDVVYFYTDLNSKYRVNNEEFKNIRCFYRWLEAHVEALKKFDYKQNKYKTYLLNKFISSFFNYTYLYKNSNGKSQWLKKYIKKAKLLLEIAEYFVDIDDKNLYWVKLNHDILEMLKVNGLKIEDLNNYNGFSLFDYIKLIRGEKK